MIQIIIADDHHLVRKGIRALLEQTGDIQVVAEASDGHQAIDLVEKHRPDVLLIDVAMDRLNGIQAAEHIRQRGFPTRIVVLSAYSDRHLIQGALRAGIKGYLLKFAITEELILAVRAIHQGHSYFSPEISHILVSNILSDNDTNASAEPMPLSELTLREREILKLVAEGHTSDEIATILQVKTKTVQKHRANLMTKLDIHNIAGLTQIAIKYGLIALK